MLNFSSCNKRLTFFLLLRSDSSEAAEGAHYFHPLTARCSGGAVRQDPVPGHLHEGRGGAEDQPAGVQSSGEDPAPDVCFLFVLFCF